MYTCITVFQSIIIHVRYQSIYSHNIYIYIYTLTYTTQMFGMINYHYKSSRLSVQPWEDLQS